MGQKGKLLKRVSRSTKLAMYLFRQQQFRRSVKQTKLVSPKSISNNLRVNAPQNSKDQQRKIRN